MMASKKGYRNVLNFTDDSEMRCDYFGLIAHGKTFYISRFRNVNDGRLTIHKLDAEDAVQIQKDWKQLGWSNTFVDRWIMRVVT